MNTEHEGRAQKPSEGRAEELQMSQETARFGLLRLISLELGAAGFSHVEHRSLIENLEGLVCGLLDGIVHLAYELAQLSNRSRPNVRDMLAACADQGIEVHHLNHLLSLQPASSSFNQLKFQIPRTRTIKSVDPTLDFLPSDPESDAEEAHDGTHMEVASSFSIRPPTRKRHRLNSERIGGLPHLPSLPAKHAWIHTTFKPAPATVIPPEHLSRSTTTSQPMANLLTNEFLSTEQDDPNTPSCLGFLNRRIRDTRLVERSLTNLVQPNSIIPSFSKPPPPPPHPTVQSNSPSGTPTKLLLSEADIPIINFERDWYPSEQ
ncbi:hypothetical protein VP01_747g5 [Puccinia sorghi]|uniref:Transcription initiation factor TFIID subunit 8 n=1 Tax=Puccinia sorghi TaxID=27349 RepID=A0A0L6UCA5_9BASI|nr:hypothetical protein VP01_747g5 [Puccinia sorghi]